MKRTLTSILALAISLTANTQTDLAIGRALTETKVETEINAPIEKVWASLSVIGDIFLNSPTVDSSYISSEQKTGIGASRHMILSSLIKKGATLDERVIVWEEGTYLKLAVFKIYDVSGIQTMVGDFRMIKNGDKTTLQSTLSYSMTSRMWGMMNKMAGKKKFAAIWRKVIAGYKYHIETGEEVTEKTELDISAVKLIETRIVKTK